jgi:hypothetical protein
MRNQEKVARSAGYGGCLAQPAIVPECDTKTPRGSVYGYITRNILSPVRNPPTHREVMLSQYATAYRSILRELKKAVSAYHCIKLAVIYAETRPLHHERPIKR